MAHESYPVSQAARLLGISSPTVRRMAADGELESFRTPGGHLRITRESVEAARTGRKDKREAGGPSPVLRNRRERVEELALEAQELRAQREIEKLRRDHDEEQAQLEAEAEAQERQADREAEAARLRLERVKIQQERERERHEAERGLQAFHTRWHQEAEKYIHEFRFRLKHPWLSHAQRRKILNACEAEIADRQLADEPLMKAIIGRTVSATIEPWEQTRRIVELRADAARVALWKLPRGTTDQEKARAVGLIRRSLAKLPASAAEFELRAVAEESIEPLCCTIERRQFTKEVSDWAVRQLPWEAMDVDKDCLRRECLEALEELPNDVSDAEAHELMQELVDQTCEEIKTRKARAERRDRKGALITQGVREVFSYLLELRRDGDISSGELWDSQLRHGLEEAVRDGLGDQLTGQETIKELKDLVREIVDEEIS